MLKTNAFPLRTGEKQTKTLLPLSNHLSSYHAEMTFCLDNTMPASPGIYLFQRSQVDAVTSAGAAEQKCAAFGGDILHFRPSDLKAMSRNYFSRDYPAIYQDVLLKLSRKGSIRLACQSKVARSFLLSFCDNFKIIFLQTKT